MGAVDAGRMEFRAQVECGAVIPSAPKAGRGRAGAARKGEHGGYSIAANAYKSHVCPGETKY